MEETKTVRLSDLVNVYETAYTLPSGVKLNLKPLTTGQLKNLLIYENETNPMVIEDALDRVMASSVVTPNFSINDVTLQDRMDLMLELRNITKGSNYTFTHKCAKCGMDSLINKDLKTLTTIPVKETLLTLKVSDRLTFDMGFPTRGDQKRAYVFSNAFDEGIVIDSMLMMNITTATMAFAIKNIYIDGGVVDVYAGEGCMEEKVSMLETLPRSVHNEMTKFFTDNRYGTEFDFDFSCIHCGNVTNMVLPLNDFFV